MRIECIQCHDFVDIKEAEIALRIRDKELRTGPCIEINMVCVPCGLRTYAFLELKALRISEWSKIR